MTRQVAGFMILLGITALTARTAAAEVISGQINDFEDGTTQGWLIGRSGNPNRPVNITSGGPTGAGDGYLRMRSGGGNGAGSKLAAYNESQWIGDFLSAGITSVSADLKNFGNTPLNIRLQLENPNETRFLSIESFSLPVGSGWQSAIFGLGADDLVRVQGTAGLDTVLGNVAKLWIFHNGAADFPPSGIVAELGVDNLTAVPEPSTILMCLIGASILLAYYRRRRDMGVSIMRKLHFFFVFFASLAGVATTHGVVRAEFPQIRLETVTSGELFAPVGLVNAADGSGRLFAIEQRGKVQIIQNGSVLATPFLDLGDKLVPAREVFDERGLLGLAFHPDYGTSGADGEGKFYVYYSAPQSGGTNEDPIDHQSVIAEYRVSSGNSNVADPNSERIVLTFNQPQFNHDGGQLAFGPDKLLYIGTGDGGSSDDNNAGHTGGSKPIHDQPGHETGTLGNAQDKTKLLGKILRIDPAGDNPGEYGIPADNPFVNEGGGVREEIYAYGLRNPWRFSFDDGPGGTGRLFVADVGQGDFEEVNLVENGGNYGWRIREGSHDFDPLTPNPDNVTPIDPIAEYSHPGVGIGLELGRSVTGGYVYRGSEFPELVGKYIFGDWSDNFNVANGTLLGLEETLLDEWDLQALDVEGFTGGQIGLYITAFGEDELGELYVVARSSKGADPTSPGGVIYKITPVPEPGTLILLAIGALCLLGCLRRRR